MTMVLIGRKCADGSVVFWRDGSVDHQPVMRFAPWLSNKPDYRYKYVMYNCSRYHIMWDKRKVVISESKDSTVQLSMRRNHEQACIPEVGRGVVVVRPVQGQGVPYQRAAD